MSEHAALETIVFDILGTVVDERGSVLAATTEALARRLSWHCVLSGSMVRSAKPDDAVYQLAIETLQLDPSRALFVACHPWDLRAAARQGFRTAYVHRPGEAEPTESDRFDLIAVDLADLVQQLIR